MLIIEKEVLEKRTKFKKKIDALGYSLEDGIIKRLDDMGFFDAPASTKYHGNYVGGLFDHSYEVARQLVNLTKNEGLQWKKDRSPVIVGLLHDLCKADQYVFMLDGRIVYNQFCTLKGHGDKSVILVKELFPDLTEEEELCIRWHMGAFDDKENWTKYTEAIHKYPNVFWTHSADMIASHIVGI